VISWTLSAPTISIQTPAQGASYALNRPVTSSFSCAQTGGTIASCADQHGDSSGTPVDTSTSGSHTFSVTATAQDGQTTTQTVTYTVDGAAVSTTTPVTTTTPAALAPVAVVSSSPGTAGLTYRFSARHSYASGSSITGYRWTLDGQVIGTTASIAHQFPSAGRYIVVLTITDASGRSTTVDVPLIARSILTTARVTVHFAVNRAGLTRIDQLALIKLRAAYAHASRVQIAGYCAAREKNQSAALRRLSLDRAETVLALLRAHGNRSTGRVSIADRAASDFVASNRTAAGRAQNRRATVLITYARPIG